MYVGMYEQQVSTNNAEYIEFFLNVLKHFICISHFADNLGVHKRTYKHILNSNY